MCSCGLNISVRFSCAECSAEISHFWDSQFPVYCSVCTAPSLFVVWIASVDICDQLFHLVPVNKRHNGGFRDRRGVGYLRHIHHVGVVRVHVHVEVEVVQLGEVELGAREARALQKRQSLADKSSRILRLLGTPHTIKWGDWRHFMKTSAVRPVPEPRNLASEGGRLSIFFNNKLLATSVLPWPLSE